MGTSVSLKLGTLFERQGGIAGEVKAKTVTNKDDAVLPNKDTSIEESK